jgi:hypothetical protein
MRRTLALSVFIAIFAMTGTPALANDNNDGRIGQVPGETPSGVPCRGLYTGGLYTAGVGLDPATRPTGGMTYGTPGWAHVEENDEEMCHQRPS